jgi:RND family efflux transporter MFP subunit
MSFPEASPSLGQSLRAAAQAVRRWIQANPVASGALALAVLVPFLLGLILTGKKAGDFQVRPGSLAPRVPLVGTVNAARSDSYGATVPGVEVKILWLVEEGKLVEPGEKLIQFDPAPFQKDLDTARARAQELSGEADQARLAVSAMGLKTSEDLQTKRNTADLSERELSTLVNTTAPLTAQESANDVELRERTLHEAEAKLSGLAPFVEKGYVSQEEYRTALMRRDQAAADLKLAQAKHAALVQQTNPDLIRRKADESQTSRSNLQMETERAKVETAQAEAAARVATARLEEARRQIAEAEKKIAACTVVARGPGLAVHSELFDKGGERRKIRVGDAVWGGTTVVTLPDLSHIEVEGRVPESEIHLLAPGQTVQLVLDAFPNRELTGTLRSIGSVGASEKNDSRSFPVTISVDQTDARFRPGMIARANVRCAEVRNALFVPIEAVHSDEKGPFVLVITAFGRADRRHVTLGTNTSQYVEVRSGLHAGETVRISAEP